MIWAKSFDKLMELSKKVNVTVKIQKKVGIRYFFHRYKKRKIFAICILFFLGSLVYSTQFVWNINVYCEDVYTSVQIKKYIEDNEIKLGTKVKNVDCSLLEKSSGWNLTKLHG